MSRAPNLFTIVLKLLTNWIFMQSPVSCRVCSADATTHLRQAVPMHSNSKSVRLLHPRYSVALMLRGDRSARAYDSLTSKSTRLTVLSKNA